MAGVVVTVAYRARADRVDVARAQIRALVDSVLAREPECAGIRMLQDADDATRFLLVEHWPGRDVFLGPHMQQPHIREFIAGAGEFLAGPPDIAFWDDLGPAVHPNPTGPAP